ncbi:allantoicase [Actinoallomurus rhizosphaericola]|uniref:allantoicase n=1 Tax=Actinoallomurus rhizosphaericola TaxID=2952536 RepID=UPI002092EF6E|nr:allantoicase [Actinoallomurus rhizosphaericola]MCO5995324.1 allantoicase [Actinoallomurus rhizosphaericola]
MADVTALPDLAVRSLGGSVMAASDESFAERENLINPWEPEHEAATFGRKGQVYDGWETARRRPSALGLETDDRGHDWALIRLGLPGMIRGVIVDTAWFRGNFPPYASVEACAAEGYPSAAELTGRDWAEIVPRGPLRGDTRHLFPVETARRFTHVRLNIFPDGGVARLRVHGEVIPDPRLLTGLTVDLAALENGARVTGCSNLFYSHPENILMPGLPRDQAECWETARRRDAGNDWVVVELAAPGVPRLVEIDTTHLKSNAPGWVALSGRNTRTSGEWTTVLPPTRVQPDGRHRFRLRSAPELTHVRLDLHPDGGLARLRVWGDLTDHGERTLHDRWTAFAV